MINHDPVTISFAVVDSFDSNRLNWATYQIDPQDIRIIIDHLVSRHGDRLHIIEEVRIAKMTVDNWGQVWTGGKDAYTLFHGGANHVSTSDDSNRQFVRNFCLRHMVREDEVIPFLPSVVKDDVR